MSGNLDTKYPQSRGTVSQECSDKAPTVVELLRAWRKADKSKLREVTPAVAGSKLQNIHIELMLAFMDKGKAQEVKTPAEPDYVLCDNAYTYDVMGEWVDRQATTVKKAVKYLKVLRWVETTIDLKRYRGTTEVRVYARRAKESLEGVGEANITDIKDRRRCESQKRKADTRNRPKGRERRELPDSWVPLIQTVESWPGDSIEWLEAFRNLYRRSVTADDVCALLMQHTTDPLDPQEFIEAHAKWMANKLKRHKMARKDIKESALRATVNQLKSWDND